MFSYSLRHSPEMNVMFYLSMAFICRIKVVIIIIIIIIITIITIITNIVIIIIIINNI